MPAAGRGPAADGPAAGGKQDPRDQEAHADLDAFEAFATFADYEKGRERDPDLKRKEQERLDARLVEELMRIAEARKQPGYDPAKPFGRTADDIAAADRARSRSAAPKPSPEEKSRARRDAVLLLRKAEKLFHPSGRGPPGG